MPLRQDPQLRSTQSRVLAVRVGRAGDMVMITPALSAVLARHAGAEVHLLTSADGRRVLRGFDPRLKETIVYPNGPAGLLRRAALRREIAAAGYSDIYCFESHPRYRRLLASGGAALHVLTNAHPHLHFAERCLRVVIGEAPQEPCRVWLPLTDAGRQAAQVMLAKAGITERTVVVGLHPGFSDVRRRGWRRRSRHALRAWPIDRFGALARRLAEDADARGLDLRIVVDVLPDERALGESLVAAAANRVTLLAEPPDFERYKATIARMDLLVAPNTGPMHIAAALGTPVVALFAGFDPADCGPCTDPTRAVVLRAEDTAHPEQGLAAITVDAVFDACLALLRNAMAR